MHAYSSSTTLVGKTYFIKTFGCQMNLHESERVSGLLDSCGCIEVAQPEEADIVCYMSCCVREKADTRLYGQVSATLSMPAPPSGRRVVCVGGCLAQRDGEFIRTHAPAVDVVFGTQALEKLPSLLEQSIQQSAHDAGTPELLFDVDEPNTSFSTDLPQTRKTAYHAWVPIMYGCNNFCTFCIVPYVRGRERSRTMEDIVFECERLVGEGVREITLLGQNVNSYGRNIYGEPRFAELLYRVGKTGIERLRFTSSNPKDLNDSVIKAMAEVDAVVPHLHLALQSGSNRVLRAMNRAYTREKYIDVVRKLKKAIPDIALTTDIIVGFPGETEQDFQDTLDLVRELEFSAAYTFIYSRREGTVAARMQDDTPHELIQDRFERLTDVVAELAHKANMRFLGRDVEVLVEKTSKRNDDVMVGHSPWNQTVHFTLPDATHPQDVIGRLATVQVTEARTWYLFGSLVGNPH